MLQNALVACQAVVNTIFALLQFAYSCFLKPLGGSSDQSSRLDSFYKQQASVYDATRSRLLKGRDVMLRLLAATLQEQAQRKPKRLVWLDIGGGTGWNIERMHQHFPIDKFEAVYLIDLCEPLLEVARKRFADLGWKNVHCIREDACAMNWTRSSDVDLVTFSYSLSMIPNFYAALDTVERLLSPEGIVGVADFYVSGAVSGMMDQAVGPIQRQMNWLTRVFWLHWFEFDHVDLHQSRRQYLEWRFGTLKSYNGRNHVLWPLYLNIPYYVFLGCRADRNVSKQLQTLDQITYSPQTVAFDRSIGLEEIPDFRLEALPAYAIDKKSGDVLQGPFSAFGYQKRAIRMPYKEHVLHKEFRTWIYGFVWEDPAVDMQHFDLTSTDSIMCITSAGCNALHYAIAAQPARIHAVDINPCQGHLVELKLAAIASLPYEDFWMMFGEGRHTGFRELLDSKLSPHLSSHAYQFWKVNASAFDDAFYLKGYSGHALRLAKWAIKFRGLKRTTDRFANASTLLEQQEIWNNDLRSVLLGPIMSKITQNPIFFWNALGVPMNQANMFLQETTAAQYAADTFDPVALQTHLRTQNHHYYLCLQRKYSKDCHPLYLSEKGYEALRADNCKLMDNIRLHTDTILNALLLCEPNELSIFVAMDHMDWYKPSVSISTQAGVVVQGAQTSIPNKCELTKTIRALRRALKQGGRVFWRSAGLKPWYCMLFEKNGFRVESISQRAIKAKTPIDNVNMYASFWKATKL